MIFVKYFDGGTQYSMMSCSAQRLDATRFYVFMGTLRRRMESSILFVLGRVNCKPNIRTFKLFLGLSKLIIKSLDEKKQILDFM